MAENIKRHVTHIKSKVVESGLPKLPTASQIQEGEIAVNYAKGYETLSMKNESGDVVTFETKQLHYGTCATAGGTNKKVVTVDGPFVLKKGVTVAVKFTNSNTTASTNVTLNVNNTGDYPIYYQAAQYTSSATTVCGAANYIITYMFNGTQWAWISINYLDGNSDTIGYSLRYGSNIYKAYSAIYRYMILLTKGEDTLLPVTTASNVTVNTKTITTESFDPFGKIFYYSATSTTNASAAISNGNIWDRYTLNLTYSFNVASVLTTYKYVYLVAQMQSDGTAKLRNPSTTGLTNSPITQTLPSSDDGYIYILLGKAYGTTAIQLYDQHPIYYYKDGAIREYTKGIGDMAFKAASSYSSATEVNTALSGKSNTGHTHDDRYYTEAELTGSSTTVVVAKASSATTAASAAKLSNTSAIGSGTQPVFFTANGVPSATTYSLSKSVPSNAVFTDTATTLSGHYTITATTADTKSANASSTSELSWGSSVVTGVTLSGDAKGHITAVSVASGKLKTPVTGVTLASGTNNGTVKLTVNGSATDNIAVKGLGTAAYKAEGYFAGSGHSHTNMVTGSSLTANNIILGNGNSAIKDSGKSIETTLSSTLDTTIPTSKAVATYVTSQMTSVLTYKGAISANATLQNAHKVGDVYVVSAAGTYAGKVCEVGDYLIANTARESASTVTNADWDAINGENQVENKSASLAAAGSSATLATVDGTNITITTPSNWKVTDTDTAVTQTNITTNGSYEVLLASSTATATTTGGSNKNVGMTYNPSTSALTVSKKITTIAANNFITGTGTAGSSGGTPTTYYPAKWTFNKGITVADGDMFTIKIPVAGHTYGTYLSLNNGTNYYPIVTNGTTILTTQYPVDNYITVVYETGGTATSIYPVTGGTATGTSAAGVFRVVNYKDTTYSTGTAAQLSAGTDTTQRVWAAKNLKTGMDALYQQKGSYATNAFSRIKVNTTNVDADTTGDTFTISGGTFVSLTGDATNDKMTIGVSTGTSNSTLARGDHNHDTVYVKKSDVITSITSSNSASTNPISTSVVAANELVMSEALNDLELRKLDITAYTPTDLSNYYTKSETSGASEISTALGGKVNTATKVSTASGLTGGGNLSANRTLGLAAVTVAGYTGSSVTSNTVSYDAYGRISSAASIIYSAVTVSSNLTNVTCPSDITGTSKSGSQAIVIYHNGGSTTDYDISISTTNIISPSGEQVNLKCPKSGYCEVNFLNIGGTIFVRGV